MKKVLVANRGEIAVRIIRACKEMGLTTVAIYSNADKNAMHAKIADEAICIGPYEAKKSYLSPQAIINVAILCSVDAIHPGYGFLSENAHFAEMVEMHGFIFIGPSAKHLKLMGNKISAKKTATEIGLPVVPGSKSNIETLEEALKVANKIKYPVLIKATEGGGGKGMKVAYNEEEMKKLFDRTKQEAFSLFGSNEVYIEKFLKTPRHIEVQILGDKYGNMVHLYERDCSLQRQNQKVIEEALSPGLTEEERDYICNLTVKSIKKLNYYSVGTVEYLYEEGKFYFMEMNTRLQVEHPITEFITGLDLVYEMIRVAQGKRLKHTQKDIKIIGHAIECRINAEDAYTFMPSPGKIEQYHPSAGPGVRIDTAIYSSYIVPPYYDSMIAKLIVHGHTRKHCLLRLKRSLDELIIEGIKTNIPLHMDLIEDRDFINGSYNIKSLESWLKVKNNENSN